MLIDYSQHCSFKQTIVQTFDGHHPCNLCKHVSDSKATEKDHDNSQTTAKTDLICLTRKCAILPALISFDYPEVILSSAASPHQPPSPPPRASLS